MTSPIPAQQPVSARAAAEMNDIGRLTAAIHAWNGASEHVYLAVGEEIQNLHRQVSQVRDGIRRSTEIFVGEEIGEMRQGLAMAAEDSQRATTLSGERSETLAQLQSAVEIASSGSAAVLLVFRLLDYVVLIARAQVEGMSEGQDELGPFTAHVDELVSVGEGVARRIDERTRFLRQCLSESRIIQTQAGIGGGGGMIDDFLALAAGLEAQQRSSAERRDEAHAAFTSIWKAIGGIVAGLQFHDTARQRLEHTIANLDRMRDLERTGLLADDAPPIAEDLRPTALQRIASLETAQLDDLALVYETKMGELDGNLALIGEEIQRSEAILRHLSQGGDGDGGGSLDRMALGLKGHFKQGEQARQRVCTSLDHCVEATHSLIEMTVQLDDLEYDLKIAGLNAAVRAAHVNNGDDTIGYIARVICEQASIARKEANRVREGIELAVVHTGDLSQRILPAISEAEGAIEGRLGSTTAILEQAQASSSLELDAALGVAASLGSAVEAIRRMMTPHIEGCHLMRSLGAAIAGVAADITTQEVSAEDMADLLARLAAQYTMAEERAIFAAVMGQTAPVVSEPADAEPAVGPLPGSDEDLDDILF